VTAVIKVSAIKTIEQHGKGIIKNNMLSYQGSYFKVVDCDISALDGTEVEVIKIDKNNACGVINLVCTSVIKVFTLEINLRTT
jgi:hypothetical protein